MNNNNHHFIDIVLHTNYCLHKCRISNSMFRNHYFMIDRKTQKTKNKMIMNNVSFNFVINFIF